MRVKVAYILISLMWEEFPPLPVHSPIRAFVPDCLVGIHEIDRENLRTRSLVTEDAMPHVVWYLSILLLCVMQVTLDAHVLTQVADACCIGVKATSPKPYRPCFFVARRRLILTFDFNDAPLRLTRAAFTFAGVLHLFLVTSTTHGATIPA